MTNMTIPETTNLVDLISFINIETSNLFTLVLLLMIVSTIMIILIRKGEPLINSLGISSFVGLILGSILVMIELVNPSWLIYFIAGIIISVLYNFLKD
jgi:hypothetical protein